MKDHVVPSQPSWYHRWAGDILEALALRHAPTSGAADVVPMADSATQFMTPDVPPAPAGASERAHLRRGGSPPRRRVRNANLAVVATGALACLAFGVVPAAAAAPVPITEYPVLTAGGSPDVIVAGPDGNLWFTEQNGNNIGEVTPSGAVSEYPVPTADSQPGGIALGPDGNMWFTEVHTDQVGKITPSGAVTEYNVSTSGACPTEVASGPDGNMWFTQFCTGDIDEIDAATATPANPGVNEYPAGTNPDGIALGPDGNIWFTDWGGDAVGKITPSGAVTEYPLPTPNAEPEVIAAGPDGNMWFTEQGAGQIGEINPATATPSDPGILEYPVPTANSDLGGIAQGPDGNMWFTEQDGNNIGEFNPANLVPGTNANITEYPVPTPNSSPYGITAGPDGNIWFAEYDGGNVSKLVLTPGTTHYTVVADVSGSEVYGPSAPSLTYTDDAPVGVSFSGTLNCLSVNGGTPISGLDADSYTLDGTSCSGLDLSGPDDYTLSYVGAPAGFVVSQAPQTVEFTSAPPSPALVGGTYNPTASASSGLPVSLSIDPSASSVCSMSGSTVSFNSTGSCVVDANQAGDTDYASAAQVQQSRVAKFNSGEKGLGCPGA